MKRFLYYTKARWGVDRWVVAVRVLTAVLLLPALYAVGLAGQPELFSYVEDGMFYGTYKYDFSLAVSLGGGCVVGWWWLYAAMSLSRYRNRRSGPFWTLLPAGWGVKFAYEALTTFIVLPAALYVLFTANDAVWRWVLVEPTDPAAWNGLFVPPVASLGLIVCFAALFFMVSSVVRRGAVAWCGGILLVFGAWTYLSSNVLPEWTVVRTLTLSSHPTEWSVAWSWVLAAVFVAVAARAMHRMEVK